MFHFRVYGSQGLAESSVESVDGTVPFSCGDHSLAFDVDLEGGFGHHFAIGPALREDPK